MSMNMDAVTYGIVGFGGIAEQRIAKEGFSLDRSRFGSESALKLAGACDVNPSRRAAAEKLRIHWYDSYDAMLTDPAIEAIYVATSNTTHFETARKALEAGKHVLVEKPVTTSMEDARILATMARKRSLSLSVNLMMPNNTYNQLARELLHSGTIGHVEHLVLHMEFLYGSEASEAATWRCSDPLQLGGPIGDVGGHCLDMAEFLSGSPISSLSCTLYPKILDIAVENGACIQYRTLEHQTGTIRVAFSEKRGNLAGTLGNLGYEAYGSQGVLRAKGTLFQLSGHPDEPYRLSLETETEKGSTMHTPSSVVNIYQKQLQDHARSIRTGTILDGSRALHNLALILACHRSAAAGGESVQLCDA